MSRDNHEGSRNAHISGFAEYPGKGKILQTNGRPLFTMTKDDIQLLYEYDRWADSRGLRFKSLKSF
jgi:hypothetical protein